MFFKIRKVMKKILSYIIVLIVVFLSCREDISKRDSPAFQGVKDNAIWRANDATKWVK